MVKDDTTIGEVMEFLKENMVTHEELDEKLKDFAKKDDLKNFVTKDDLGKAKYDILDKMEEKLSNLKTDLVVLMRKEDRKLGEFVQITKQKKLLTNDEAKKILSLEPFPQ